MHGYACEPVHARKFCELGIYGPLCTWAAHLCVGVLEAIWCVCVCAHQRLDAHAPSTAMHRGERGIYIRSVCARWLRNFLTMMQVLARTRKNSFRCVDDATRHKSMRHWADAGWGGGGGGGRDLNCVCGIFGLDANACIICR